MQSFSEYIGSKIIWFALAIFLVSIIGMTYLKVENSFIDYFKQDSEIYKGMKVIDKKLGGTTLLDITIDLGDEESDNMYNDNGLNSEEFAEDEFDFEEDEGDNAELFFTSYKMNIINNVHDYLETYEEIGKVMSFSTLLKVGKILNNGNDLDIIQLALLYSELPDEYKKIVINPYISIDQNQARITMRIIDSLPNLRRNELIGKLSKEVPRIAGVAKEKVHFSNVLILYNNMLQSSFKSQILTLGSVLLMLLIMFMILFRSLTISLIALL